ncbi:hypothetical protein FS837_001398 [Tulasnella sp. UAMH 9824]|nr:hypothetical protein FS837_001398 [Tulasnella sp. UAMH 9824]
MNGADPPAIRGLQDGKEATSLSLLPQVIPILAARYATGTSASTVRFNKDEDERTEDDRLSFYLPFDHTWSPPPLNDPDFICNIFDFGQLIVHQYHSVVFHCRSPNLSLLLGMSSPYFWPIRAGSGDDKKFHTEHFTCSVCSELLKPQGAWNGNGDLYCRQHYSIWSATKCTGCCTVVENPFVGIELGRGKRWHRECYLLNKFWDIKLAGSALQGHLPLECEPYALGEVQYGASTENESQIGAEALVHRIWDHLSKYEESSLDCLSEIALHVGNGVHLLALHTAKKLVLHIEVLFAAIDELERAGAESLSQNIYAENLFHAAFDLIEAVTGARDYSPASIFVQIGFQRERSVQALQALTPSLASHHKNLMIVALKGALSLKHETAYGNALLRFLDRLQRLAWDRANPSAHRPLYAYPAPSNISSVDPFSSKTAGSLYTLPVVSFPSIPVDGSVAYGYQSLSPQYTGDSTASLGFTWRTVQGAYGSLVSVPLPNDECIACLSPIKEACVRRGTYERWHSHCFACATCGKSAEDIIDAREGSAHENLSTIDASSEVSEARPPTNLADFRYGYPAVPLGGLGIYCTAHLGVELWRNSRFEQVSRLEQYAFLLYTALRRSEMMPVGYREIRTTTAEVFPVTPGPPLQTDTILGRPVDTGTSSNQPDYEMGLEE